ncbi:MAG: glutamate synthase-related protein, partial [bacterium]
SDRIIISSEIGAIPLAADEIASDGQLEPGCMLIADLENGTLVPPESATEWIVDRTGLNFQNLAAVDLLPIGAGRQSRPLPIKALNTFGWTQERIDRLRELIKGGKEPIHGMGNDSPLAIFSENHSRLYSFLHQIVAVVTNPPIDPLREGNAIDTTAYLGRSPRLSRRSDYKSWPQYKLDHPILTNEEMEAMISSQVPELKTHEIDATFIDKGKSREMVRRIHDLTDEAVRVIRLRQASILVVSDYASTEGDRLPLPMLLVVSSIHQALAAKGLRRDASIVVETGSAHEGHDCAILLSYGATAVNPYAMLHLAGDFKDLPPDKAADSVIRSIVHTLRRVMSKMGITTLTGYRGSALFEAIGISSDVVEYYMPDTVSRLGGVTMEDIYDDIVARASSGDEIIARNKNITVYRKEITDALQLVARNGNARGDYDRFTKLLNETPPVYLRDMLEFKPCDRQCNTDDVASAHEIVRTTIRGAAMSHGALNSTAHRAIASAFNSFESLSSSGEGGEDERRNAGGEWHEDRSRVRQIASGRFGVDAAYLVHADEIEIKIGQGAKPGEGGHLPGAKVTEEIARIRKTKAGIDLISPPPHHDIYSIEDLAQLVTNLRQLHPRVVISVKVPAVTNLGTIGIGIAKAGADVIVVSGFEGGTGAASSGSIAHAGLPLDRGVSELHQYLVVNGIRSAVRIRADGGIKSGMDAAKIIALGADEVSIGTPLLVAENCIFCRGCNKGNCPVGIATQDEAIQNRRFMRRNPADGDAGPSTAPERYEEAKGGVIRYLECMGGHLRHVLASLCLTHPRELVGRVDLLRQRNSGNSKWDRLDLTDLLQDFRADMQSTPGLLRSQHAAVSRGNMEIINGAKELLEGKKDRATISIHLENCDHAVGATLAGEIARMKGSGVERYVEIDATGYAGHGFGFAATDGMALRLKGFANDGVAEAMSGSTRIVIVPPDGCRDGSSPHLAGNAAAYGATGGRLYIAGRTGQRFGVRNSGAVLVCEGTGKYAFEYMTGGIGVVLGKCGTCIGSGMTGGELFIHDPEGNARSRLHSDVAAQDCISQPGKDRALREILEDYAEKTRSPRVRKLLTDWQAAIANFVFVHPR